MSTFTENPLTICFQKRTETMAKSYPQSAIFCQKGHGKNGNPSGSHLACCSFGWSSLLLSSDFSSYAYQELFLKGNEGGRNALWSGRYRGGA